MAFVVILFRGEEFTRRELTGPLVIGRAPECDISVRDILLSRRHCQIVPEGDGWAVEDLGSKNGTRIKGEAVSRVKLADAMSVRLGKTQVKFYAGKFRPGTSEPNPNNQPTNGASRRRPADPFEALSGTVSAFEYKPEHGERDLSRLPSPRPKPSDPASYADEDVYSLLTEIASSSWDSIYATASGPAAVRVDGQQPAKPGKKRAPAAAGPVVDADLPPRGRHVPPDPSLQVFLPDDSPEAQPQPAPSRQPAPVARRGWLQSTGALFRGAWQVLTGRSARRAG